MKAKYSIAIIITVLVFINGCIVSTGTFNAHKKTINNRMSSIEYEIDRLDSKISSLKSEMYNISLHQQSLNSDVSVWLEKSEAKLKEMEDRVIELRLIIRKYRENRR